MNQKNNKLSSYFFSYKNLIGLLISVTCLYFVYQSFDWVNFIRELININYFYLLLSILCLTGSIILRAFRWKKIFSCSGIKVQDLYRAEIIGFWGNSLFPLRLGEVIRIHYVKVLTLKKYSLILSTMILERLIDLILIGPFVFIFYYYFPMDIMNDKIYFLLSLIPLLFILYLIFKFFFKTIKEKLIKNIGLDLLSDFMNNKVILMIWSFLIWLLVFLDVYFVQMAMHLNLSIIHCLLIMFVATVIYAIPSSPGTIGTFHIAIQEVMVNFLNQTIDTAIAFAFILHAHSYLFFIILGSYYFLKDSKNILSFRG
tara:strand:+ start:958 stop:1896 length:939 start_codon:yes stop_codon:yes gene_type:complete